MSFPMPGDRCAFKLGRRYVNGTVIEVTLRRKRSPSIHVRVNKRIWKTRYEDYCIPVTRLSGWVSK